jgi:diguanylate cyclase (GGDEF)-like protein
MHPAERRVLVIAAAGARAALEAAVGRLERPGWHAAAADSLEQAGFVAGVQPCDVALLHDALYSRGASDELARLAGTPVVLAGESPAVAAQALRQGAAGWLPWSALSHPELLGAVLSQALARAELATQAEQAGQSLRDCQGRVDRLLGLLWEATPTEGPDRWFTQRHMLERLEEEVARSQRHGGPLSLILAEVHPSTGQRPGRDDAHRLAAWAARRIGSSKRRCDVVGQYGLTGFMLLLPRGGTAEAVGCCARLDGVLRRNPPAGLPGVSACFGVAALAPGLDTVKALLRQAEEHLEQARTGAGRIVAR